MTPRVLDVFLASLESNQREEFFQGINNIYYQKSATDFCAINKENNALNFKII